MGLYSNIERYAPEIDVVSAERPEGRMEHGFIQPLDFSTESSVIPLDGGDKYGKYLLLASTETISPDETYVVIGWAGRKFELVRREEFGLDEHKHIECLVRCIGRYKTW